MSGIYIPGERIPDTLTAFWIFPDGYVRVFGKNGDEIRGREAMPVPDHGRLIDADRLVDKHFSKKYLEKAMTASKDEMGTALVNIPLVINSAPTIIPADKED